MVNVHLGSDRTRKGVNAVAGAALLVLFLLSLNSLTSYPPSFDDEGAYALAGHTLVADGVFLPHDRPLVGAFERGDGIRPRLISILFGRLGDALGHSLATARTVSFVLAWASAALFAGVARSLGAPALPAALALVSSERVFHASHVFRPEAALLAANVLFLLAVVRTSERGPTVAAAGFRGVLNGLFVLTHGNGLVTALLNGGELLARKRLWCARRAVPVVASFAVGSVIAIWLFALVQVYPVGGWSVFFEQLRVCSQYGPSDGLARLISAEVTDRWWTELCVIGESPAAKLLRVLVYAALAAAALRTSLSRDAVARRVGLLAMGCLVGFTLLVADKQHLHITEMMPFLLAPLLAWRWRLRGESVRDRTMAATATIGVVVAGLLLSVHHAVVYRRQVQVQEHEVAARAVTEFLSGQTTAGDARAWIVTGDADLWFWLGGKVEFLPVKMIPKEGAAPGRYVAVGVAASFPQLRRCAVEYRDEEGRFVYLRCP